MFDDNALTQRRTIVVLGTASAGSVLGLAVVAVVARHVVAGELTTWGGIENYKKININDQKQIVIQNKIWTCFRISLDQ